MSSVPKTESFSWDAPSKELYLKTSIPLTIQIGNKTFVAESWSMGGFAIRGLKTQNTNLIGKNFPVKLCVQFRDFNINIDAIAVINRYEEDTEILHASFKTLKDEHKELLKYFIQAVASGEMVNIDNVIRRVDMPVTSPGIALPSPDKSSKKQVSRFLFSGAYLLSSLLLLSYVAYTLYFHFFNLTVESAIVNLPLQTVQSTDEGVVESVLIKEGEVIEKGDAILHLSSPKLQKSIEKEQANQQRKEIRIQKLEALLKSESKKQGAYQALARQDLQSARARLASIRNNRSALQASYDNLADLANQGLIPRIKLDKPYADLLAVEQKVVVAQTQVANAKSALNSARNGYASTGSRLDNDAPKLRADLAQAKAELSIIQAKLDKLLGQTDQLTMTSPFTGTVKDLSIQASQYLKPGENVLRLIPSNQSPEVIAYLTQAEINKIRMDSIAKAYIPAIDQDFPLTVTHIDRTERFFEPQNNQLTWQGVEERTGMVKLAFKDQSLPQVKLGLPVMVSFEKQNHFLAKGRHLLTNVMDFFSHTRNAFASKESDSSITAVTHDAAACTGAIWKPALSTRSMDRLPPALQDYFLGKADKLLDQAPSPLSVLHSAGITDANDQKRQQTIESLRDSKHSALLAIAYRLTGDVNYLNAAKAILLAWANKYIPDGHPINESKFDGMLIAYDMIKCDLSDDSKASFIMWMETMQSKKLEWTFGESSGKNNHRTHQLKMLVMLDKLLNDQEQLTFDRAMLKQHLSVNLFDNGESLDFKERDSLHYHVYDLEAWLELALMGEGEQDKINRGVEFLLEQLKTGDIDQQFVHSKQAIDQQRSDGGFKDKQVGGQYPVKKAMRTLIAYSTLNQQSLDKTIVDTGHADAYGEKIQHKQLLYLLRYYLWS